MLQTLLEFLLDQLLTNYLSLKSTVSEWAILHHDYFSVFQKGIADYLLYTIVRKQS